MFSSHTDVFFEQEVDDGGGQDVDDNLALAVDSIRTLGFAHAVALCRVSRAEGSIWAIAMRIRAAEPRRIPSPPAARS